MHPPEKTILETDLIIDIEPLDIYIYMYLYIVLQRCVVLVIPLYIP